MMISSPPSIKEPPDWTGRIIVQLAQPIEVALVRLYQTRTAPQVGTLADVVSMFVPPAQLPPGFDAWRGVKASGGGGSANGRDDRRHPQARAVGPEVVRSLIELGNFLQAEGDSLAPSNMVAVVSPDLAYKAMALEWAAQHSALPPLASLLAFYFIDARPLSLSTDSAELFTAQLRGLSAFVSVMPEPSLELAAWKVTMDARDQGYIKGGQGGPNRFRGINAAAPSVWGQVDGAPIGFVDFERGWDFDHPELPRASLPQPLYNVASLGKSEQTHGTSVLSVVLAKDNADLVVGIAPGATFIGVVSPIQRPDATDEADKSDVVGALLGARQFMKPGDVLVIEQQLKIPGAVNYPMEAVRPNLDAIRLLAASGIVVIEAGGNGAPHDLDDPLPTVLGNAPTFSLNPNSADFIDSGAVLVGSCRSFVLGLDDGASADPHHAPSTNSPRGARVDCSAWGEDVEVVRTPTKRDPEPTRSNFNGTSAAAAIIAGAALLVQSLAFKKRGAPLAPLQLRQLLSNRSLGTPIVENNAVIGSMPNLARIAAQMELLPDLFVADTAGDNGARDEQLRFDSPDIVVRGEPIEGVASHIGAGSAFAEIVAPSDPLNASGTNFVYLRVRNGGKSAVENLKLRLFWAEAGVMMPPNRWHFVAATGAIDIPGRSGSKHTAPLAVAPPMAWDASSANPALPAAPARVALIAVATHEADPAPLFALPSTASDMPPTFTPNEARDFFNAHLQLLHSNNVAMLNRHALANVVTQHGGSRTGDLAFRLFGVGGIPYLFDLELTTETPDVADVRLLLPTVLHDLVAAQLATIGQSAALDAMGLRFPHVGSLRIPAVALAADADFGIAVRVTGAGPGAGTWTIAQIAMDNVVGRLTFSLPQQVAP